MSILKGNTNQFIKDMAVKGIAEHTQPKMIAPGPDDGDFDLVPEPPKDIGYPAPAEPCPIEGSGSAGQSGGGGAQQEWPYPRIWQGKKYDYYATKKCVYRKNGEVLEFVGNLNYPLDLASFYDYDVISGVEGSLHVFQGGSILVTKAGVVENWPGWAEEKDYDSNIWQVMHRYAPSQLVFRSTCNYRGQLIVGDIIQPKQIEDGLLMNSAPNMVAWSNIGAATFTQTAANETGNMPMPWVGKVLLVRVLGDAIMVYCENGIGRLYPSKQYFGLDPLLDIGVKIGSRTTQALVAGGETEHVFIDCEWNLWTVKAGEFPVKQDFSEWLSLLRTQTTIIRFDPMEMHYYITDNCRTFVYASRSNKMFEVGIRPNNIWYEDCKFHATYANVCRNAELDYEHDDLVLTVDTVGAAVRGVKTLTEVTSSHDMKYGELFLAAAYRYFADDYKPTPWILSTQEGSARVQMSASDVRVRLKLTNPQEKDRVVTLGSNWQYPDNRYVRSYQENSKGRYQNDRPTAS